MAKKENKDQLTIFDFMDSEPEMLYYNGDVLFQQVNNPDLRLMP